MTASITLSDQQREELFRILSERFAKNMNRHAEIKWDDVQTKLEANPQKLWSLHEMERTEGEPDVVGYDEKTDEYIFYDCSPESPVERRNVCYDQKALEGRKKFPPADSAVNMAINMGIELLDETQYRHLQTLGTFDAKTSSWIKTPADIRARGGAIFADFRFGHTFVYHNGADSYYSSRGFRGMLRV